MKKLAALFGIDGAVLAIVLNRAFMIIQAPLFIYFLLRYLSPAEQGFWYTFKSLSALSVFAELGFTVIITQFVSHEFAHLKMRGGFLRGSRQGRDRLFSLVMYAMQFYLFVVPLVVLLLSGAGALVFRRDSGVVLAAWLCYSVLGGANVVTTLVQAVYQGLDKAAEVQRNVLAGTVAIFACTCSLLWLKAGIWALVFGTFCGIALMLVLLWRISAPFWLQLARHRFRSRPSWFREVVSLQWRYAISWISGYLTFHFMIPVAKYYAGPVEAGRLGMSISMVSAIQALAGAWVMARIPQLNMMVALKQREELHALMSKIQRVSMFAFCGCALALVAAVLWVFPLLHWQDRILPLSQILLLLLVVCSNIITGNWAFYLRAHKEEPYMLISLIMSVTLAACVWGGMMLYKSTFFAVASYAVLGWLALFAARVIYVNKRKEYDAVK